MKNASIAKTSSIARPRLHFTPRNNWQNDPNGLVYHAGEYHLFFQYNPQGKQWGHMSWGHAVSPDLLRWTELPLAIPEETAAGYTIFSGSAVIDHENASGLGQAGQPPLVAVYTADYRPPADSSSLTREDIHLAVSLDNGRTFRQHAANPLLAPNDPKFGDPKVFRHATGWVMVCIRGHERGWIEFYGSSNLREWTLLSRFADDSLPALVWECPDLFRLPDPDRPERDWWVLKTNQCRQPAGTAGDPLYARTVYWLGDFDGQTFTAARRLPLRQPLDDNYYAEVSYNNLPADDRRVVQVGWMGQPVLDVRDWTGMQSLPREMFLYREGGDLQLGARPVRELQTARGQARTWSATELAAALKAGPKLQEKLPVAWAAELDCAAGAEGDWALELAEASSGRTVRLGFDAAARTLYLDIPGRSRRSAAWMPGATARLQVIVDGAAIEAFADGGRANLADALPDDFIPTALAVSAADAARLNGLTWAELDR